MMKKNYYGYMAKTHKKNILYENNMWNENTKKKIKATFFF
jgi:hypothetical protein